MKISFFKITLTLVFLLLPFLPSVVSAASTDNMSGFAWSSNIGWISFNCTNTGSCGSGPGMADYGVNKAGDVIAGYAWSSNIGWIKFGGLDLTNVPTGAGTLYENANIKNNKLVGWARACAGTVSGDCAGASRTDGWDGWISLTGAKYGVTLADNKFNGYAWGSDVVGWLNFNVDGPTGVIIGDAIPSGAINATPCIIVLNASTCNSFVTWITNNLITNNPTQVTRNNPVNTSVSSATAGTDISNAVNYGTSTYFLLHNGAPLAQYSINATCAVGTGWSTNNKCETVPVDGGWTDWGACVNGTQVRSCTNPEPSGCSGPDSQSCGSLTTGSCSSPQKHYECSSGGASTNRVSSPSRWTWTCSGTSSSASCSEKKGPGVKED